MTLSDELAYATATALAARIRRRDLSPVGLPVGKQLIGRRYDADVLAASGAYERLRPWHDAYSRCATRPLG